MNQTVTAIESVLSSTRCPQQTPGIIEYEIDDEVVLYEPRSEAVHMLNPTAAVVWWLCDGEHGIDGISQELAGLYELDPRDLRRDVGEILRGFLDSRLIGWR